MKKLLALGMVATFAMAGCTATPGTSSPTSAPSATSSSTPSTHSPASTAETGSASSATAPQLTGFTEGATHSKNTKDHSAQALPIKVRVGSHPDKGFDRVVVEYSKAKAPVQWSAEWTAHPTEEGSGFPVDLRGNITLEVFGFGIRYPKALEHVEDLQAVVPSGSVISEVKVNGGFEGSHQIYIGSDKKRPYKVSWLDSPARLVIDIAR